MKKTMRKTMGVILSLALAFTGTVGSQDASAKSGGVKLNKKSVTVEVNKKVKLKVKKAPKKAKVKWSVNKKKIASVSKKGVVKGKAEGKAVVTAKVTYKNGKKKVTKKLKCKVTVKAASVTSPSPAAAATKAAVATTAAAAAPTVAPTAAPADASTEVPAVVESSEPTERPQHIIERTEERINETTGEKETVVKEIISTDDGSVEKDIDSITLINEKLGQGINLGNTLEATLTKQDRDAARESINVDAFECAWGAPKTTQAMIDGYKQYGFNTVRIPIAWSNMIDENDSTYKINDAFMNRVEEVVNYCINADMYAIINIHWDSGWWSQFGAGDEWNAKAHARYTSFWNQIAERFKDYSDKVIFESANEEFCEAFNHEINEEGYRESVDETGNLTEDQCYELSNELNQEFVDIVRNSGGNNEFRHLLIAGIRTDIELTCDDRFKMPVDPANEGVNKLSVSVHYYTPWDYCGNGQNTLYWGSDEDKQQMLDLFTMMEKFTKAGYGVMIGEYSVVVPQHNDIPLFLNSLLTICKERSFLPILWDTPGLYYDRKSCKMIYSDVAKVFNEFTGSEGDASSELKSGEVEREVKFEDPENLTLKWSWEGTWCKNDGQNYTGVDRVKDEEGKNWISGGEKVTATDLSKWVTTTSCTDESQIVFNDWGYVTLLNLDWSQFNEPYIIAEFINEDKGNTIGNYEFGTQDAVDSQPNDIQKVEYDTFRGKCVNIPIASLKGGKPYLYFTFTNCPIFTSIKVYDKE
ncbi:MAG: glycoside hydrolase family 5 protein [Lachnospiraceae bacterium]|nr:glycoside hydrolase family 5 protein [Lachnospiraceae bacterium]